MAATSYGLKESSIGRRTTCIKNLVPYFAGLKIRSIRPHHCEKWAADRSAKIAPQTMAHEREKLHIAEGVT